MLMQSDHFSCQWTYTCTYLNDINSDVFDELEESEDGISNDVNVVEHPLFSSAP